MDQCYARPYYKDTGRRPYLYYAVIGIDGEAELEISRWAALWAGCWRTRTGPCMRKQRPGRPG